MSGHKRKGFSAGTLVMGLLIFFMVIAGFVDYTSEISTTYNYTNSSSALSKYNNLTGLVGSVSGMGSSVANSSVSNGAFFFIDPQSIWRVFSLFFSFGNFVNQIGGMVITDFHLPVWLITSLNTLVLLIVVLTIISAAMRKDV